MAIFSSTGHLREKKDLLTEESVPKAPVLKNDRQNLESKIESILRSIENLTEKQARISFEITRQKRSLVRKREELKRVSKSSRLKASVRLESSDTDSAIVEISGEEINRIQKLLSESARVLEE